VEEVVMEADGGGDGVGTEVGMEGGGGWRWRCTRGKDGYLGTC
jgi:hypothetical protein